MALREILIVPDPRLKKECAPVEEVNDEIKTLLDDMLETMYAAPGIGLAAPQIGVMKRVVVMDVSDDKDKPEPLKLINPEIIWGVRGNLGLSGRVPVDPGTICRYRTPGRSGFALYG